MGQESRHCLAGSPARSHKAPVKVLARTCSHLEAWGESASSSFRLLAPFLSLSCRTVPALASYWLPSYVPCPVALPVSPSQCGCLLRQGLQGGVSLWLQVESPPFYVLFLSPSFSNYGSGIFYCHILLIISKSQEIMQGGDPWATVGVFLFGSPSLPTAVLFCCSLTDSTESAKDCGEKEGEGVVLKRLQWPQESIILKIECKLNWFSFNIKLN